MEPAAELLPLLSPTLSNMSGALLGAGQGSNLTLNSTDLSPLSNVHYINDLLHFDMSGNFSLGKNYKNDNNNSNSYMEFTTMTSVSNNKRRLSSRPFPPTSHFLETLDESVMPVALCVGIVGNILLFTVFTYTPLRGRSLSHYLAAMGVADLLYLLSCLVVWLLQQEITLYHTIGVCQLTNFTLRMSRFLGTWYLFAAHVERFLVHFDSLRTKAWCSTFRAKFIIVTIFIFSMVGYLHYIWTSVVTQINGHNICMMMRESYKHIRQLVKIEIIAAVFLPMLLIVLIDIALIINVVVTRFNYYFRVPSKTTTTTTAAVKKGSHNFIQDDLGEYALAPGHRFGSSLDGQDRASLPPPEMDIDREKCCATIVVAICGLFFIGLLLPSSAYTAWYDFAPGAKFNLKDIATTTLFEHLIKLNSVYKIVLYLIFLRGFRHGLLYLVRCEHRRKRADKNRIQETTEV